MFNAKDEMFSGVNYDGRTGNTYRSLRLSMRLKGKVHQMRMIRKEDGVLT